MTFHVFATLPAGNVPAAYLDDNFNALALNAPNYALDTGSLNIVTITTTLPVTAYADGQVYAFRCATTNTGAATVNVNTLGAKNLYRADGSALQAGDIVAGNTCIVIYNGLLNAAAGGFNLVSGGQGSFFPVTKWGADPTGATDSASAVTAALAAMPTTGGILYFGPGTFHISSVTVSKPCIICGAGATSTQIYAHDATSDVFNLTNAAIFIRDLAINASVTRTAGSYILCNTGSSIVSVENCYMLGWWYGIRVVPAGGPFYFRNVVLKNGVPSSGQAVRIENGTDVTLDFVVVDNPSGSKPDSGVAVLSCSDVTMMNCQLQHCNFGLNVVPSGTSVASSVYAVETKFDNAGTAGVRLSPLAAGAAITRVRLNGCWASSSGGPGVLIDNSGSGGGLSGIELIGLEAILNTTAGVICNVTGAGNGYVDILGGKYAGNGSHGLEFFNCAQGLKIIGARSGPTDAAGANTQYGIAFLNVNFNQLLVADNDVTGNTAGAITGITSGNGGTVGSGGTDQRVVNNIGYNDGASRTVAISVTGSPFTYTAGPWPETVYIFGGIVSGVVLDGASIFAATGCTVRLSPKKSVVVTYTGTPTMVATYD